MEPMNKTKSLNSAVPLDCRVIQYCKENPHTSIKDLGLLNLFDGNNMTTENRASRRLAKLCKSGYLTRVKVHVDAQLHDGTRWLYSYDAA